MKKLYVDSNEKKRILESHGFIKEQTTADPAKLERQMQYFLDAIKNGCLKGTKENIVKDGDSYVFKVSAKSGSIVTFYSDNSKGGNIWKIEGTEKTGKWNCPEAKPVVSQQTQKKPDDEEVILPGDGKESELTKTIKKGLENINPTTLKGLADDAQKGIDASFTLKACKDYISIYFTQAQQGLYIGNLEDRKKSIYACFNMYQAKLSDDTRDQLRWLSGNEEGAKTFGVFKRYKNIGTINDNKERSMFRLDRNFK